jgi:hypothetical protein
MKVPRPLVCIVMAIIVVVSAISSSAARRSSGQSLRTRADNEEETFVISRGADGKAVCRRANATEHERIINRDRQGRFRVIYGGAPKRSLLSFSPTWTDLTSGLTLQPSAGLRIILHGTTQLEQNQQAKSAFIVAANRWEAIISTPINSGEKPVGARHGDRF